MTKETKKADSIKKTEEDLIDAGRRLDYEEIQECLVNGVSANSDQGKVLYEISESFSDDPCLALKCIKLLYENGLDLTQSWNCLYSTYDFAGYKRMSALDVFSDVTYSLRYYQHGKKLSKESVSAYRQALILLLSRGATRTGGGIGGIEELGIMTKEEFRAFSKVGEAYIEAQKEGKEFDVDSAIIAAEKSAKIETIERKSKILKTATYGGIDSLPQVKKDKARLQKELKSLQKKLRSVDRREEKILERLASMKRTKTVLSCKSEMTLSEKEAVLDDASFVARNAREDAVAQAAKAGKPLSKEEVWKLRTKEAEKRAEKNRVLHGLPPKQRTR